MGPFKFLYNSKYDFTAKSLVTNSVVIKRVLCNDRNIQFLEAREIVDRYTAAPGYSYASITKPTGDTVVCADATTQTDCTYNTDTQSLF